MIRLFQPSCNLTLVLLRFRKTSLQWRSKKRISDNHVAAGIFICLAFILAGHSKVIATPLPHVGDSSLRINIWQECQIMEDRQNTISIDDILADSANYHFHSTAGISSMFGFTSSAYWIKFKVRYPHPERLYLTIERVSLWEADLFIINDKGQPEVQHLGVNTPFYERPLQSKFAVGELGNSRNNEYYLKVSAVTSLFVPIYVDSAQSLLQRLSAEELGIGIYVGIFCVILLYNLLALLFRKQAIYGWYLFYAGSLFVYQGLFNTGVGFEYLWPDWPIINKYYVVSSSIFGISMLMFSVKFLDIKTELPTLYTFVKLLVAGYLVMIIICILGFTSFSARYFFWMLVSSFVYLATIGVISIQRGNVNARLYLAGWGVLMLFYFYFALWLNGFIGESLLGHRALFLGSFFEMIFWFYAVSDKVNMSRKEQHRQEISLRRDVARDFHDELGNQVARLINYVGLLRMRGNIPPDIYSSLSGFAQNILDGAKDFVWALDPSNDNLANTMIHVKDFGEQLLSEKNISFRFYKSADDNVSLPYGHSRQINLIFKEAITNAFRHSNATAVELRVEPARGVAVITLKDNGVGVSVAVVESSTRGLNNIRARSAKIDAKIDITSSEGNGTSLSLTIKTHGQFESKRMGR